MVGTGVSTDKAVHMRLVHASRKSLWPSYKGRVVDVLASRGDEGRVRLR